MWITGVRGGVQIWGWRRGGVPWMGRYKCTQPYDYLELHICSSCNCVCLSQIHIHIQIHAVLFSTITLCATVQGVLLRSFSWFLKDHAYDVTFYQPSWHRYSVTSQFQSSLSRDTCSTLLPLPLSFSLPPSPSRSQQSQLCINSYQIIFTLEMNRTPTHR